MKLLSSAATNVGRKRKTNQDAYLVDERFDLFAVCDGMGGHKAGEVASSMAIEVLRQAFEETEPDMSELSEDSPADRSKIHEILRQAVRKASLVIYEESQKRPDLRGMGTTLTLLLLGQQHGYVAHVGDSRLYLFRNQEVHQITTDHSLVNELIRAGKLKSKEAQTTPFTNALTRAVGVYPNVAVDILEVDLMEGDCFLICSDGLHTYLNDETLLEGLRQPIPSRPQWFVDHANEAGGKDNITAICIDVQTIPDELRSARLRLTFDTLHTIPLFQHLTYAEMVRVINVCRAREVKDGDIIIRQGDQGDALYVVLQGSVTVWQGGRCLATLKAGRHFGEMSLVDNQPRSATVMADEHTTLIRILRDDFYDLLRQDSVTAVKLLWNFIQTLSVRMRNLSVETVTELETDLESDAADTDPTGAVWYDSQAFATTDPSVDAGEDNDERNP